jgi:lipopolysaccharide/colanic/teichoic acid biosynthesis glycosyltransferase
VIKRALDLILCVLALPFFLPLLAVISILVYLDSPGPPIFVQRRTGKGGKRFSMYKLRTMVPNAEELKAKYSHLNELSPPDFKIKDDPRVTRIGHLLRKTSLDELPQIFNIIKGEMSWVGPRPTSFGVETYRLWHTERLEVVPGLTGLWQVSGRSTLDFDERLNLDIAYIENQCLQLDLKILLKTVTAVVTRHGAY